MKKILIKCAGCCLMMGCISCANIPDNQSENQTDTTSDRLYQEGAQSASVPRNDPDERIYITDTTTDADTSKNSKIGSGPNK